MLVGALTWHLQNNFLKISCMYIHHFTSCL